MLSFLFPGEEYSVGEAPGRSSARRHRPRSQAFRRISHWGPVSPSQCGLWASRGVSSEQVQPRARTLPASAPTWEAGLASFPRHTAFLRRRQDHRSRPIGGPLQPSCLRLVLLLQSDRLSSRTFGHNSVLSASLYALAPALQSWFYLKTNALPRPFISPLSPRAHQVLQKTKGIFVLSTSPSSTSSFFFFLVAALRFNPRIKQFTHYIV